MTTNILQHTSKIVTSEKISSWAKSQTIRAVVFNSYKDYLYNTTKAEDGRDELNEYQPEEIEAVLNPKNRLSVDDRKLAALFEDIERSEQQAPEFIAIYKAAQKDYSDLNDGFVYYHPEDPDNPKNSKEKANKGSAADRMAKLGIKAA
jgi:hypothetical protein